jgi:hypothetical protein
VAARRGRQRSPRIVDQDIEASESFVSFSDNPLSLASLREICLDADRVAPQVNDLIRHRLCAQLLTEFLCPGEININNSNVSSERCEAQRVCTANPSGGAGHNGRLTGKLQR